MNEAFNCKLEYLWLDGYDTPNIRSKTRYVSLSPEMTHLSIEDIPEWGFDGSSTEQASGNDSDCILKPVSIFSNTVDQIAGANSYIVMCEVYDKDGNPHASNTRAKLREALSSSEDKDFWFGIEQEYTITNKQNGRPLGWPESKFEYPAPQGRYYCGVGADVVRERELVHQHAACCLSAGVPLCGTNAEVMLSQWEYQIGPAGPLEVCDFLWASRYMLEILAEMKDCAISLDPKLIKGDWNGSGAHINFSTKHMREVGGLEYINEICEALKTKHEEHITNYGKGNESRLTGAHETQHISKFTYGDSDRGASIRIPPKTSKEEKGYLEDRRPASNMDPYKAVKCLVNTVSEAEESLVSQTLETAS